MPSGTGRTSLRRRRPEPFQQPIPKPAHIVQAPGAVLIFHDTLIHGSPNNMSPWDRSIFSLVVNPVSNASTRENRPDHKHHRDTTPVMAVGDDCLEKFAHGTLGTAA